MKLYLVKSASLDTIKQNLSSMLPDFEKANDPCEWLEERLGTSPFEATKFPEIPQFTLDMSSDDPSKTDGTNAAIVYENLKFLSDSQATDERFWAALCLREYWHFVRYRWGFDKKGVTEASIKQHAFFAYNVRRSLTRNTMSRLWWAARLTMNPDPNDPDPYRLTRFACENADTVMHSLERSTSNSRHINRAFLSAILDARDVEGLTMNTNIIGDLAKYLNLLGGVYVLDCFPEKVIYEKILAKAREIDAREKAKQEQRNEEKPKEQKQESVSKRVTAKKSRDAKNLRSFLESISKKKRNW